MNPKYTIGQSVYFKGDLPEEAGQVLSYSFDGTSFTYVISSKEVDIKAKKIIEGVKHCKEDELVEVEEKK